MVMDSNSAKLAQAIATRLWTTMLFIVVMSLISLFGGHWWLSTLNSPRSSLASFWLWFIAMIVITGYAVWAFVLDARIQLAKSGQAPPESSSVTT